MIKQLTEWVAAAESIVVLTGAGISTASGIPDFRSAGGIYSTGNENVFDLNAFIRDPTIFYNFARVFYPQVRDAQPNTAHLALAEWQQRGKDVVVVTQNVDDYHQRAGSNQVYAVHGNSIYSTCLKCGDRVKTETLFATIERGAIPTCSCKGVYKPDITFFGEMLPEHAWEASARAIRKADLVLVLGTSLTVYPAAGLPAYRHPGSKLAIVNREPTSLDFEAGCVIRDDLCAVMEKVSSCWNVG